MLVQLILSDNDSGRAAARMGQGPGHILAGGPAARLQAAGHQVETIRIDLRHQFPTETGSAFETAAALARQVRSATRQRRFPVILAGNCMASVGVVAGHRGERTGIVWLDAHADFHTPETTRSGFLDGMALSVMAGDCWASLAQSIPGFRRVDPPDILLLGTRDVEEAERRRLEDAGVGWFEADALRLHPGRVGDALASLAARVDRVHLHVDLDVLDPAAAAPANGFTPPGGLQPAELAELVTTIRSRCHLGSLTISAYDPVHDRRNAVRDAALEVIEAACASTAGGASTMLRA